MKKNGVEYFMRVHHYRNALTHYLAWEKLRWVVAGRHKDHAVEIARSMRLWNYVIENVVAPSLDELSPNGGLTVIDIVVDGVEYHGEAHCCILDRFINATGRNVALKNILARYEEMPRAHRVLIGSLIK